jgi:hypothetical protein
MNDAADALSRPPGVDKGDHNNQGITLIPLTCCHATMPKYALPIPAENKDLKRSLMLLYHNHPTAGHPGQDKTLHATQQ